MSVQAPSGQQHRDINWFRAQIEEEIVKAKQLVELRKQGSVDIIDFDIRGRLYALAMQLAPRSRDQEAGTVLEWIDMQGAESCVDIAAGTGVLTAKLVQTTKGNIYAIDPSQEQLSVLSHDLPRVQTVQGSPDDARIVDKLPCGGIDVVTSQGGIHHVPDQQKMFRNIAHMLKVNGKCVCADVCADTTLSNHFDHYVSKKCLTGHDAIWLDEDRINSLLQDTPLEVVRMETLPVTWEFNSKPEMALFFKGLHAYDLPEDEILADIEEALGMWQQDGKYRLGWPLLFFHLKKRG